MSDRIIQVTAPTRLHCGLLSVHGPGNRFGGAGLMVNEPGLQLTICEAERFETTGPLSERVRPFVETWMKFFAIRDWPTCRITIERITPAHVGLGTGTQLGLAIAAGLNRWLDLPKLEWTALAASVGRGLRSAIGTYGFHQGGFLVERGKAPDEPLSPLDCRLDIPTEWRFVLLRPTQGEGLSGDAEQSVFATNGSDEEAISQQLREELRLRMVPAMASRTNGQFRRLCMAAKTKAPKAPIAPASVGVAMAVSMPGKPPMLPSTAKISTAEGMMPRKHLSHRCKPSMVRASLGMPGT